jgi:hypothetical protein
MSDTEIKFLRGTIAQLEKERDEVVAELDVSRKLWHSAVETLDILGRGDDWRDHNKYEITYNNECIKSNNLLDEVKRLQSMVERDIGSSAFDDVVKERDQLKDGVDRLTKILRREFNENDELGAEYLGITMVREENSKLRAQVEKFEAALGNLFDGVKHLNGPAVPWSAALKMAEEALAESRSSQEEE